MKQHPQVAIGQVYEERDKRMFGRRVKVMAIETDGKRALCAGCNHFGEVSTKRRTKIALTNLQTRFDLVGASNE